MEIKNILHRRQREYYRAYREARNHHEKSYNFAAWQAINKLNKEITEEIKKKAEQ